MLIIEKNIIEEVKVQAHKNHTKMKDIIEEKEAHQ